MAEENIFNNNEETPTSSVDNTSKPQTTIPQELVDWVGEGKKYSSIDEVYKAFPHSQQHIETLTSKVAQLEEELSKRKSAEEVLNDIRSKETVQQKPTSDGVEVNKDVLSEVVARELASQKAKELAQSNLDAFKQEFTKVYGDKAEDAYTKLSQETGFSYQELNAMAAKSPNAVLKLAGVNEKATSRSTAIDSSVNTQALLNQTQQKQFPSSKVTGGSTQDLMDAMSRAREKVLNQIKG
jgi:DNA-binding ferritin-like protein